MQASPVPLGRELLQQLCVGVLWLWWNWKQSYRHTQKLWISSWWQAYPCHRGRLAPGPQSLRQKVRQGRQVSVLISSRANYFNRPKSDVVLLLSAIIFCWTSEIMKLTHNCNWRNCFCPDSWHDGFGTPSKNLVVFSWFFCVWLPSFPGSRKICSLSPSKACCQPKVLANGGGTRFP